MNKNGVEKLVRPLVRSLHPYVPGEQPKIKGLIKLNTNENPYPPSPKVLEAIRAAVDDRIRLYPNPTADALRAALAKMHGCNLENIIVGNGSDELLALASRAFVEPLTSLTGRLSGRRFVPSPRATVQYFSPSYSLYPVLADIQGAARNPVPLEADYSIPEVKRLRRGRQWDFRAALSYVTTPNAPSGRGYSTATLEALCKVSSGVIILDEAYVDFSTENAMALALKYPNVIVARTFSKAFALCFQRIGYFVGSHTLIEALHKIRDSYNVNGLGQVAAAATLDDLPYYRSLFSKIIRSREQTSKALADLGFTVFPSQSNFILVRPPARTAQEWAELLRNQKILVRWFDHPNVRDFLRISIGTDSQMTELVRVVRQNL
jgi:histidinol-phosphate aminotransferase